MPRPICNLLWPVRIACFAMALGTCALGAITQAAHAQEPAKTKVGRAALQEVKLVQPETTLLAPMSTTEQKPFGKTKDGKEVSVFTLTNGHGVKVRLIDYGATLISVETPDKAGKTANITLGFPTLVGYLERHPFFGSTVGRYGNRIAGGKFKLDGKEYKLATNNGPNHLHGGIKGFDAVMWKAEAAQGGRSGGQVHAHQPRWRRGLPGQARRRPSPTR